MKKIIAVSCMALVVLYSCKKEQPAVEAVADSQPMVPAQAPATNTDMVAATQQQAQTTLALSEPEFDFGQIKKGDQVEHIFKVTNTGKNPLIISSVVPTCGCTVPEFTKDPIMPGKTGSVTLKFDSSNFDGVVHKTAELYANVAKVPIELSFTADIKP